MRDKVIGRGSPKKIEKSPWECRVRKTAKESKWAKDAQEKTNGMQEPASNITEKAQMTILSHK